MNVTYHTLGVLKWLTIIVAVLMTLTPLIIMINIGFNIWLAIITMSGVLKLFFIGIITIICHIEKSDHNSQYSIRED